jgi:hypothetical protein
VQHGCRRSLASLGMTGASLRWERRAEPVIPRPEGPRDRLTGWIILATNPRRSAGPTFAARVAHSSLWGRRSCGGGGGQEKRASGFAGASGGGCGGPSERSCGRSASGPPREILGRRSAAAGVGKKSEYPALPVRAVGVAGGQASGAVGGVRAAPRVGCGAGAPAPAKKDPRRSAGPTFKKRGSA